MGLNFYAVISESRPCEHCGRYDVRERLHIGKSSAGWCFSLHVIPEMGIHSLDDWKTFLQQGDVFIEDEDHTAWGLTELLERITNRRRDKPVEWTQENLERNHAELGPNNLVRHRLGHGCIGHGEGTWDLITGDFS